jgi:hypothetical protein
MQSKATTPEQYLSELPEDRKEAMLKLRNAIKENFKNKLVLIVAHQVVLGIFDKIIKIV